MNPLEQIDAVFFWLKEKIKVGGSRGYNNIQNYIDKTPELKINQTLLREIIERLVEDGYINEEKIPGGQPVYHITFNGLIFEGYQKAKADVDAREQWQQKISAVTVKNAKKLNWLTVLLVVFTGISAFYYAIEIYKFFVCTGPCK